MPEPMPKLLPVPMSPDWPERYAAFLGRLQVGAVGRPVNMRLRLESFALYFQRNKGRHAKALLIADDEFFMKEGATP